MPIPVDNANQPDMGLVLRASETVGKAPTVYPGATEEECGPVLEKASGLKCGSTG